MIGTLSRKAAEAGCEVVIVSSDKDMLQLVTDQVSMLNPAKDDTWYDPAKVKEFMGVEPRQVADLLALKGDAIDNIPGAPGIGDKGAKDLIEQFGSVEAALDRAAEVTRKMYRESLQNNRERIQMSLKLATIDCNVPVHFDLESLRTQEPDVGAAEAALQGAGVLHASEGTGAFGRRAHARFRASGRRGGGGCLSWPECRRARRSRSPFRLNWPSSGWRAARARRAACLLARLEELRSLLENADIPKATSDLKSLTLQLAEAWHYSRQDFRTMFRSMRFLLDADPAGARSKPWWSGGWICVPGRGPMSGRSLSMN